MKLAIGETIEIDGKESTVCFETTRNETNYICVAFEDAKVTFEIYKYKFENEKLMVSKVTDPEEVKPIMATFVKEGLEESELPEDVANLFQNIANKE